MKARKPERKPWMAALLVLGMLSMVFSAGTAAADDTEVYQATVKNNAMMLIDLSGSMNLPVYDHNIDYTEFLNWAEDPDATDSVQTSICVWQKWDPSGECYYDYFKVIPHRQSSGGEAEPNYPALTKMLWERDKIYLVSADIGYREIVDEEGGTTGMVGDFLWYGNITDEYPYSAKVNVRLITYGMLDTGWTITDWDDPINGNTIDVSVDAGGNRWVVYPSLPMNDPIKGQSVYWVSENLAGQRLRNHADIQITKTVTDDTTGVTRDVGFLGYLKTPGIYFSGLFRDSFSTTHGLTADPAEAYVTTSDDHIVYGFVTGNFLSFLKLVNGLNGNDGAMSCTDYIGWPSSGWRSICYQPVEHLTVSGLEIRSHPLLGDLLRFDYLGWPSGWRTLTPLNPGGFIGSIRVKFEYLDTDACGDDPDFAELRDADNNVLVRIKGMNLGPGAPGIIADAGYQVGDQGNNWTDGEYIDDTTGWTPWFSANTEYIKVYFFNGSDGNWIRCNNGAGDRYTWGFKIIGYEYTTSPATDAELTCCNGPNGVGYKIQSRLDIAKTAMKHVVDATRDTLNWGLAVYPDYEGMTVQGNAELRVSPGEGADAVIAGIDAMNAYGSTPTGMAMQLSYNYFDTYLDSDPEAAACANNYLLLVTDGYPNEDYTWSGLVTTNDGGNPDFAQNQYHDSDTWSWYYSGELEDERADDVAAWMAGWQNAQPSASGGVGPDYNITTHAIGFNFENPLLGDIADDGSGLSITAYNRDELINAFYTLTLSMASTVSFIAPVVSVDEANRTQSGDQIYMAFFRPQENGYWQGNLKKFGLAWEIRDDCGRTEGEWTLVDKNGNIATGCDGTLLGSAVSYWSTTADGVTVDEGGVGGLLMDSFEAVNLASGPHYSFRNIYTYKDNDLVPFTASNIDDEDFLEDLGLDEDDPDIPKMVNFVYGYTYAANPNGSPVAKRDWILGDMIHTEPEVIEYFDPTDGLLRRYIAVGANDGLLHVFVDYDSSGTLTEGSEVFAFVPPDLIPSLKQFANPAQHFYTVDGAPNLWRGSVVDDGDNVWETNEFYQKILVFGERRGGHHYWALDVTDPDPDNWDVAWRIEGGLGDPNRGDWGFRALGQTWSRPQFARIRTGSSSFRDLCIFSGGYDTEEDNYPEPFDDSEVDPNGQRDTGEAYDDLNQNGQYDIHNLDYDEHGRGKDTAGRAIYVVDVTDGSHVFSKDKWDDGYDQMRWCFPADPTVIPISLEKLVIYAPDIYGQIWKVTYTYTDSGHWSAYRIFKANPGSDLATGSTNINGASADDTDLGRKMFYGPDVSYRGNCWTNYPVLYFGTGDREHPNHSMVSNRFYAVKDAFGIYDITEETDLLNLTCDELEDGAIDIDIQTQLKSLLISGDAKGAYRVLDDQENCVSPIDDHTGEKMLSQPALFFNNLYFTTYQPVYDDPCAAGGNARTYALDYCWLTSVFDLYDGNSTDRDVRDTYQLITSSSIPSGVRIITRSGEAAGIISAAGSVSGVGEDQTTKIPAPPAGVTRMLWETD